MIELLLPSLIAGVVLCFVTGPLGCFVVWRKISYFGDTLSHAALLGVALGFLLQINLFYSVIFVTIILALWLLFLESQQNLSLDTLLGILAHSSLSLGIVVISLMDKIRIDLMNYLFGDLLSVSFQDALVVTIGVFIIVVITMIYWRKFLFITISEDLAFSNGINIAVTKFVLTLTLALTIGLAMKFVGALIITSLLIIPAATAKFYAKTPEQMAMYATVIGMISVVGGLTISGYYNTPTGPSIVITNTVIFIFSLFLAKLLKK